MPETLPPPLAVVLARAPLDPARALAERGARADADARTLLATDAGVAAIEVHGAPWDDDAGAPGLAPGALHRATEQPHLWPEGAALARAHRAHLRIQLEPAADVEPLAALHAVTDVAVALLAEPEATAIFFPRGEALRDGNVLGGIRAAAREQDALPLQAWTNGRIAAPLPGWRIADVVGLGQLGAPDHEAAFPEDLAPPFEVLGFLYDLAHHLALEGGLYPNGMTLDGPGGRRWMARHVEAPLVEPPRPALRWMPLGLADVPAPFLAP